MLVGKRRAAMAQVSFDPCAVALLDRLLERAGARLVVHSGRRRTIGTDGVPRHSREAGHPVRASPRRPRVPDAVEFFESRGY